MDELLHRTRAACFLLSIGSMPLAFLLAILLGLRVDIVGFGHVALFSALILSIGMVLRSGDRPSPVGDICSMLGLMLLMVYYGGAIAIMSTRSPMPMADAWLIAADGLTGFSAIRVIGWVSLAPMWIHELLKLVYETTGLWLILSMVLLPLLGMSARACRMMLLWILCLVVVSLLAFAAPALGSFSHVDPEVAMRLPRNAGSYAFDRFNDFRFAEAPVLSIHAIGAVVTFPSFHTICALLVAQAWAPVRWVAPIAAMLAAMTIISTVPIGGHYVVDLLAGALVWWCCTRIVDELVQRADAVVTLESSMEPAVAMQ